MTGVGDDVAEVGWLAEMTAGWVCSWREYLAEKDALAIASTLRRHENTGRPLGDLTFLKRLGVALGRELLPKKPGPKKEKAN